MMSMGFLKLLAVWSLIPTYSLAGGLIGYALDRWLHTFPFFTGAGIVVAFGLAIRDMLRLRDEVFGRKP
jgi:F0F1-type ATP synthase assembly protein I